MSFGAYMPVPTNSEFLEADLSGNIEDPHQAPESTGNSVSRFSIEYYSSYFNVDTYQVAQRLISGCVPFSKRFSLSASLKPLPDLYGPFWITTTLIFAIAFSGSIHEYLVLNDAAALSTFNFSRVTLSSAILFAYWCLLPVILASILWFRNRKSNPESVEASQNPEFSYGSLLTELLAIYGYSMVAFIPAAALLCIPIYFLQLALVLVAFLISLFVLSSATWSTFKQRRKHLAVGLIALIVIAHIAMTVSLSVVFFHLPAEAQKPESVPPLPNQPASLVNGTKDALKSPAAVDQNPAPAADGVENKPEDANAPPDGKMVNKAAEKSNDKKPAAPAE